MTKVTAKHFLALHRVALADSIKLKENNNTLNSLLLSYPSNLHPQ